MYLVQGYNAATRVRIERPRPLAPESDALSLGQRASLKHIMVQPLILHWKYDNYLFAVVKVFFHFYRPFSE